jgi:hypothetical protein
MSSWARFMAAVLSRGSRLFLGKAVVEHPYLNAPFGTKTRHENWKVV